MRSAAARCSAPTSRSASIPSGTMLASHAYYVLGRTSLTAAAPASTGSSTINTTAVTGAAAGQSLTIGSGADAETATIAERRHGGDRDGGLPAAAQRLADLVADDPGRLDQHPGGELDRVHGRPADRHRLGLQLRAAHRDGRRPSGRLDVHDRAGACRLDQDQSSPAARTSRSATRSRSSRPARRAPRPRPTRSRRSTPRASAWRRRRRWRTTSAATRTSCGTRRTASRSRRRRPRTTRATSRCRRSARASRSPRR